MVLRGSPYRDAFLVDVFEVVNIASWALVFWYVQVIYGGSLVSAFWAKHSHSVICIYGVVGWYQYLLPVINNQWQCRIPVFLSTWQPSLSVRPEWAAALTTHNIRYNPKITCFHCMNSSFTSCVLSGKTQPKWNTVQRIIKALHISVRVAAWWVVLLVFNVGQLKAFARPTRLHN